MKIKNINTKGETNVKLDDDFDIQNARIEGSRNADWNAFEIMGENDIDEEEYVAPVEEEM